MRKSKILVIDDEQSVINSIYRHLTTEEDGYEMLAASDGKEGLEICFRENPELIIVDLEMPVMGGIEFLEKLNLSCLDRASVIVLTAHDKDENIQRCFNLGISAFLRKPFNTYELLGLVKHCISLKRRQQKLLEEVTYRKMTQEALQSQKEKFMSVLVHDLKNPLIPIEGYTKRLIEGKISSDEEKIEKLKIIKEASDDLLGIIKSTSEALKGKSALHSFQPESLCLKDIILSVSINIMSEIEGKGLSILINGQDSNNWDTLDSIQFTGDYQQLKSVFENLLGNSIKYAKNFIAIEISKSPECISCLISDDGQGIPEQYQGKIFDEYFQVPDGKKGTGLGLYSVKKALDNHSGTIAVESLPAARTTFTITLPSNFYGDLISRN